MTLVCDYCGVPLMSENINYAAGLAKCRQCGAIFGVTARPHAPPPPPAAATPPLVTRPRPKIARPTRLRYTKTRAGALKFRRPWWPPAQLAGFVGLVLFALGWNSFMLWINLMAFRSWDGLFLACLISPLTLAGFGYLYWAVGLVMNGTTLQVNRQQLTVTHGPWPWPGATLQLAVPDIRQLYARQARVIGQRRQQRPDTLAVWTYELRAVLRNGDEVTVFADLTEAAEALYIEQQLERAFGWTDEALLEEIPRG